MKILKWVLLVLLLPLVWGIDTFYINFGDIFETTDLHELQLNFNKHQSDVYKAKLFFTSIAPPSFKIYVSFNKNGTCDFWVTELPLLKNGRPIVWFQEWEIDYRHHTPPKPSIWENTEFAPKTRSLDLILNKIGWSYNTIDQLRSVLRKGNCFSIESGEPTSIGFKRSGMGLYSYALFSLPIPMEKQKQYNDSCQYILLNDTVAFQYEGGGFGSQRFPEFNPLAFHLFKSH